MKTRDAVKRLRELGAVADRTRGSHQVWTLPNGAHVVLVVNKSNADVSEAQLRSIRQVCKAAGLTFDRLDKSSRVPTVVGEAAWGREEDGMAKSKTKRVLLVAGVDGTVLEVERQPSPYEGEASLQQLQGLVGGMIELVSSENLNLSKTDIWANEEGIPLGLPFNRVAARVTGVPLVGPVVFDASDEGALHALRSLLASAQQAHPPLNLRGSSGKSV